MIRYLKEEKLEDLVKEGLTLVDFYADWCGPCKMLGQVLEQLEGINIVKVNTDEFPDIANQFKVMSIPSLFFFQDGKVVKHEIGFHTKDELEEIIKSIAS